MNYALFKKWVECRVDELVEFGVPRVDAEAMMVMIEVGSMSAEAKARSDRQFLLDFDRLGSVELGKRRGVSAQAICAKRTRMLSSFNPELNAGLKVA